MNGLLKISKRKFLFYLLEKKHDKVSFIKFACMRFIHSNKNYSSKLFLF